MLSVPSGRTPFTHPLGIVCPESTMQAPHVDVVENVVLALQGYVWIVGNRENSNSGQCDTCVTPPKKKSGRPSGGGAIWSVKLCVGTTLADRRGREERAPTKSLGPLGVSLGQSRSRGRLQGQGSCAGDPRNGMKRGVREESLRPQEMDVVVQSGV